MPLLLKRRLLAAKIETVIGTAETLANADGTFNVFNLEIQPSIEMTKRDGQAGFSKLPAVPGPRKGTAKFSVELIGGATAPAWASTFLPPCGFVASGLVFGPISKPPGSGGVKTITIGAYEDGLFKRLRGAMGTFSIKFSNGKPVMIDFEFTGIYDTPSDVALLTPTYVTTAPLVFANAGLTIAAWSPKVNELTIDIGNEVVLREDANATDGCGYSSAVVVDRNITGKIDPEANLVATKDVFTPWMSRTEQALAIVLGSVTNQVTFGAPKLQFTNIQEADRNKVQTDAIDFQLNKSAAAGDDELTLTFA